MGRWKPLGDSRRMTSDAKVTELLPDCRQFVQNLLFRLQHPLLWTLMWLSDMSEIPTCPAITNRSEEPGLPIK